MKHIIISSLFLLILFCLSKFVFDPAALYSELLWLDIPMHVIGGFGVASLAAAILSYKGVKVSYTKLFVAYMVVAVSWELSEYIKDFLMPRPWGGWYDTIKDIFDGTIGSWFFWLLYKMK
jgi:hypothetical protein